MENKFPLLYQNIHKILADYPQVLASYLFGSQVKGQTVSGSDVDVAVVIDPKTTLDYGVLYTALTTLIPDKELDLRIVSLANEPLFLFRLIQTGKLLYQRSEKERVAFEVRVMKEYYDTQHIRDVYNTYLLKSLKDKTYAY